MTFSENLNELVLIWLEWLKYHKISVDTQYPLDKRRHAAERCEELIKRRYELISIMDSYFGD